MPLEMQQSPPPPPKTHMTTWGKVLTDLCRIMVTVNLHTFAICWKTPFPSVRLLNLRKLSWHCHSALLPRSRHWLSCVKVSLLCWGQLSVQLLWLPVSFWLQFKVLVTAAKVLNSPGPKHLQANFWRMLQCLVPCARPIVQVIHNWWTWCYLK